MEQDSDNGGCCKIKDNLVLDSSSEVSSAFIRVFKCKVCGRHHYRMMVKPLEMKSVTPER